MKYYYLDGIEKKGPYEKEELKNYNINAETLVFFEGLSNWKPIKDIPELNRYLFEIVLANDTNDFKNNLEDATSDNINNIEVTEPPKIKIPSIALLFLSFLLCIGLAYYIVYNQRQNDSEEINKKIDDILNGKSAITDYTFEGIDGQLYDVYLGSMLEGLDDNINVVKTEKRSLAYKPTSSSNSDDIKRWNLFKDLVQYYETAPLSGFNVLRLERNSTIFSITSEWSGDMAYKVPATRHYEGYSNEYFSSPGYDLPTYRPTIGKCYEEAAKFLTSDKEDKSYVAGSFNSISSFKDIETIFFELKQRYPIYTRFPDKIHVYHGEGIGGGDLINEKKITDATSANDSSVFTSQWIVWYKSITNTYEIQEKNGVFIKYWLIYSIIGISISTLIYFFLKFRKRLTMI